MPATTRRRLGVALVLDPPARQEVDGLRRAVGDPSLGRIPPHLTLVPPVNVRVADFPAALDRLQAAAAGLPPRLQLTLGAVNAFLPVNPVLYLSVGGDLDLLRRLRDAVFAPPLERRLSWPWVPHVTLADGGDPGRIIAALEALASYAAAVTLDRVVLLEEGPGRCWTELADASLGRPVQIGTGGLPVTLVRGRLVDPRLGAPAPPATELVPVVALTAYREGQPAGWARAGVTPDGPFQQVWVAEAFRGAGVGRQLLAHLSSEVARRRAAYPKATEA